MAEFMTLDVSREKVSRARPQAQACGRELKPSALPPRAHTLDQLTPPGASVFGS
jgi:hypothetical protein